MSQPSEAAGKLPLGPCSACLKALCAEDDSGLDGFKRKLADGRLLMAFYCRENSCGCYALMAEREPLRWRIESPISSPQFAHMMQKLPAVHASIADAAIDVSVPAAPGPRTLQ